MRFLALAAMTLVAGQAFGQDFRKHNFTFGVGGAVPRGELRDYFTSSPMIRVGYGYRFVEFFQADIGFDTAFGSADVRDFLPTQFGDLRIRDFQYFLPMGGRAILPIAGEKVLFSAGGGAVYMRYSERIRQPFGGQLGFRLDCPVCTSRSGWGYYGLASTSVALDDRGMFRLGATGRVIRGHTDGDPLGAAPPLRTRDHWIQITGDLTFSF